MRKRSQIWRKGTRGAISLLLALLLLPFYSLAAVLVEAGRYQSALRALDAALGSSAYSVLAGYDSFVKDRFGFLSISQDDDLNTAAAAYLNSIQLTDLNSVSLSSVSARGMYPLAETAVLRRQVLEYSRLMVPAAVVMDAFPIGDLISKLEEASGMLPVLENISSGCETVSAQADCLIAMKDLQTSAQETQDAVGAYHSSFSSWQDSVDALSRHLGTARPEDEEAAAEWDTTRDRLAREEEDARQAYEEASSQLGSSLDSLKGKVDQLKTAGEAYTEKAEDFEETVQSNRAEVNGNESYDSQTRQDLTEVSDGLEDSIQSSKSQQDDLMQECLDSFDEEKIEAASDRLDTDRDAVRDYDADGITASSSSSDLERYHTEQVDGLSNADAVDQLLAQAEEGSQDSLDFVSALSSVMDQLMEFQTVVDPTLCARIDTDYYNSAIGGIPSGKERGSPSYALADGDPADEEKAMEYLAQINPDYDESDPFGTSDGMEPTLIECILEDVQSMSLAVQTLTGSSGGLIERLEAIKDFLTALVNLISHTVQFLGQVVIRIAQLIGGAVYERLLVNGYLVYNLPNRTTDLSGATGLTLYSYGDIGLAAPGDSSNFFDPTGIATLVKALSNQISSDPAKCFTGAELEYIIWGSEWELANQALHFGGLYLFRLLLDLPSILLSKDVSSLAAAANMFAPVVYILYIFLEPYVDTLLLVNKESVPLIKTTPYLTLSGVDELIDKFSNVLGLDADVLNNLKGELQSKGGGSSQSQAARTSGTEADSADSSGGVSLAKHQEPESGGIDLSKPQAPDSGGIDLSKPQAPDSGGIDLSKPQTSGGSGSSGLDNMLEMDYAQHSLVLMMIIGSESDYVDRLGDLVQFESTAYREKNGVGAFDLDESYTVLRMEASGSLVQLLPVPALSTNSLFQTTRLVYRGY